MIYQIVKHDSNDRLTYKCWLRLVIELSLNKLEYIKRKLIKLSPSNPTLV